MPNELNELIADVKENLLFLQELGVSGLQADTAVSPKPEQISKPAGQESLPRVPPPVNLQTESAEKKNAAGASRSRALEMAKLSRLSTPEAPGIKPVTEDPPEPVAEKISMKEEPIKTDSLFGDISLTNHLAPTVETLDDIHRSIDGCRLCRLWEGRTQIVNSSGNPQAKLMFIGEAPGADEDAQGKPFVGRAGQLLTKIIEAIGLDREEVFIGNINRCRPPGNRQPQADEAATCKPFLLREIAVIRPKVIVVLGNTAMQNLLEVKTPIGKLRGNFQDYFGIRVMPTFHPAYLLRDPHKKREVWEDMKKVKAVLDSE